MQLGSGPLFNTRNRKYKLCDIYAGLTSTLQAQFGFLQSNWGSHVGEVVSGLPTGILNLKQEASQLIADGSEQFAVLTDASQKTTCAPPSFVQPKKVC